MKVLHLSSEKSWRGGEQQMAYLIGELKSYEIENHVAARPGSAFMQWCKQNSVPCHPIRFVNDLDFFSARMLMRLCRKENYDLVHLHSSRSHGVAALSTWIGNNTPMVLSRKVDFKMKQNIFSKWKYNLKNIKRIICVSEKVRTILSTLVNDAGKCVVIHDGIDLERFRGRGIRGTIRRELGLSQDAVLIGNIAALAPHKDYFTFIKTAKRLAKNPTVQFIICGEGPLHNEIMQEIQQQQLQDRIHVLGFRKDIENVFADLDILLYTSNEEGLGSTLLDAMAYGLPIVATAAGGIPEIITNNMTGLLAPVGNDALLAEQVNRLLGDQLLKSKLIANAKSEVKNYSKEQLAAATLRVYREVLAGSGSSKR